jgi:hypothetical protein
MPTDVQSVTSVTPACGKGHTASKRQCLAEAKDRLIAAHALVRVGISSCGGESVPQGFCFPLLMLLRDSSERITDAGLSFADEDRLRQNDKPLGGLLDGVIGMVRRADRIEDEDAGSLSCAELHLAAHILSLASDQLDAYLAEVSA